ncbi:YajQ family cyclic di-GMP-binding protein [candidate division WOR-1 bacterium RIFOXYB2_FULL_37_13]|uniref:Nucleotide-binding protein A2310_02040 n=1 Tax=candidate division WOR-1 bacterium RIFOXYB2_FULL_37_13 TaxID=1802579 RepID=A0A1F4SDT9_UNCSA|nr:MAG: YajQ family cyclic di-GMP-binding protein [candidate division WOR-1 bacterium RIFOXYB2_FULL_37_13]
MAQDHSFDITSQANLTEVDNAIQMSMKEILNRFDFKGSKSDLQRAEAIITIISDDDYKLKSVIDILQGKLVKRGISLKFLDYGKIEQALGGTIRQEIKIKQGIEQEQAKEINKTIKEMKLKVQSQIQGDQLRVSAKKIDDLQAVMQKLKQVNFPIELQFVNYR